MAVPTREERLAAARARTQQNVDNKNSFGGAGKQVLDFDKIGGSKKEMFYKPKAGMNHIDFIPYIVKSNRHPQKVQPGYPDYVLDLWVHRFVGAGKSTFICLEKMYGKPCPICEAREKMKSDPDVTDKEIKKLYPKRRCWYNVINLDSTEKTPPVQIFEESHFLFEEKFLTVVQMKNEFEYWDLEVGKTIEFMATEKSSPEGKHFDYSQFYFEKRQPYPDSIYDEAYNLVELLHIPSYEEVRNAFLGLDDDIEESLEEEPPARTRERNRPSEQPAERERPSRNLQDEMADEPNPYEQEAEQPRTRERRPAPQNDSCPFNHKFGEDSNKFSDCNKCDEALWNRCSDEYEKTRR